MYILTCIPAFFIFTMILLISIDRWTDSGFDLKKFNDQILVGVISFVGALIWPLVLFVYGMYGLAILLGKLVLKLNSLAKRYNRRYHA